MIAHETFAWRLEELAVAKKKLMSAKLKEEIAKELGFYHVVERDGWGAIKSRDAGNIVKRAVEIGLKQSASQQK